MNNLQTALLNYAEIEELYRNSVFSRTEVPIEYAVSLPLPTKKMGVPSYVYFASPALRSPGKPSQQAAPELWWMISAESGRMLIFAHYKVMPFATNVEWTTVELPRVTATISEMTQTLSDIKSMINELAPAFFASEPGAANTRELLAQTLNHYLPQPLIPQYRALAPDFFAWLEA